MGFRVSSLEQQPQGGCNPASDRGTNSDKPTGAGSPNPSTLAGFLVFQRTCVVEIVEPDTLKHIYR